MGQDEDQFVKQEPPARRRSSTKKSKDNYCVKIFKKIFKKLYPSRAKEVYTKQGRWLRMIVGMFCFLHCLFFVIALAITGFMQMMISMFFATLSYSVYLTLREW